MRRLSKRLVAYILLAALLLLWTRRALPTWESRDRTGPHSPQDKSQEQGSTTGNKDSSRYPHQVENFPAGGQAKSENTVGKDKIIGATGAKLDLAGKTDNLLAQWIAQEQGVKGSGNHHLGDASEEAMGKPAASQELISTTQHLPHRHVQGH
ncbi:MAG: hypothetical protein L6R40_008370 [Gallowayella cf. fulva]|nr:MAG: hypothetical protein L6R40_008370 [Xanthomendoza cf. fulva]